MRSLCEDHRAIHCKKSDTNAECARKPTFTQKEVDALRIERKNELRARKKLVMKYCS